MGMSTMRVHDGALTRRPGDRMALVPPRPCRAPHRTISDVGLIGGGHVPMPGEVSLPTTACSSWVNGPSSERHVLEVSRQPIEEGVL
jgi:magnesium chelatase family protein